MGLVLSNHMTLPHSKNYPSRTHGIIRMTTSTITLPEVTHLPLNLFQLSILMTQMLFKVWAMHAKLGAFSKSSTMASQLVSLTWWNQLAEPFSLYRFIKSSKRLDHLMVSPAMVLLGFPLFSLSSCGLKDSLLSGHLTSIFVNFGPKITAITGE